MASFQEALIIAGVELILIVDAWRLAEENNAEVEDEEAQKKAEEERKKAGELLVAKFKNTDLLA
jgi:hypothetical protein